jgi:hypothetical protein
MTGILVLQVVLLLTFVPATMAGTPPSLFIWVEQVDKLTITVNGVTLPDTDGGEVIVRISWDWGDGTLEDDWFANTHTYSKPGTYQVTVTSYQSDGMTSTESLEFYVSRSQNANPPGLAKGHSGLPPFLYGDRIVVNNRQITFPANEPFYIYHGWGWTDWSKLTPQEKRAVLDKETFVYELYIDGVQVDMRLWRHGTFFEGTHEVIMDLLYCAQFEANTFVSGETHTFVGRYYQFGELVLERTLTVQFT